MQWPVSWLSHRGPTRTTPSNTCGRRPCGSSTARRTRCATHGGQEISFSGCALSAETRATRVWPAATPSLTGLGGGTVSLLALWWTSWRRTGSAGEALRSTYFISSRCDALGSDLFTSRLALNPVTFVRGEEAAGIFYDGNRFTREGAMPPTIQHLLQDKGPVQTLEGEEHRRGKEAFLSLMERLTRELGLMVDQVARLGPANWHAQLRRRGTERWAAGLVERVRSGELAPAEGTALQVLAHHRDDELLSREGRLWS